MEIIETTLMKVSKKGTHLFAFMNSEPFEILIRREEVESLLEGTAPYAPVTVVKVTPKE